MSPSNSVSNLKSPRLFSQSHIETIPFDYPSHPSLKLFLTALYSLKIMTEELAHSDQDV